MASQREQDIALLLAAQAHLGTKNCTATMERYTYRRRTDGIYVFNLAKTYEKLQLAARIIVAIENPQDVVAISARPYGQRGVLKFGHYTGARSTVGRHTPGAFTNQLQKGFEEPRLVIVADPRTDHQAIKEAAYMNIPVIAFTDTDSDLVGVDVAIPANNKGKHSIGVLFYLLARLVLQYRGTLAAGSPWDVMVDMFFYREPEEAKEEGADAADAAAADAAAPAAPADADAFAAAIPGDDEAAPAFGEGYAAGFAAAGFEPAAAPAEAPAEGIQYAQTADFGAAF